MAVPWGTNHLQTNTSGSGGDEELAAAEQSFETSGSSGSSGSGIEAGMELHSASNNDGGGGGGGSGGEELAAAEQSFESSGSTGIGVDAGMELHSASDHRDGGDGGGGGRLVEDMSGTLLNLNQNENQVAGAGIEPNDNAAYAASLLAKNRPNILVESAVTVANGSTVPPTVPQENEHYMASRFFQLKGQCKRALFAMAYTVNDAAGKLISNEHPPYSLYDKKAMFKPTNKHFCDEVIRRASLDPNFNKNKTTMPKPSSWKRERSIEWLKANPILHLSDVSWIRKEEEAFRKTIQAANNEKASLASSSGNVRIWNLETNMRFIHVLTEDSIRSAFLDRFNVMTRTELDARTGPQRVGTCFDEGAVMMNSRAYNPISVVDPDLHDSFSEPRDLSRDACMNGIVITAGQLKDQLANIKGKVFKSMSNHELSGNGEGNRNLIDEDHEWETREATDKQFGAYDRSLFKDDNRKDFLGNFGEEVLYAWMMFDVNDLRQSVLTTLDGEQAATVDSVPETEKPSSHRKRKKDDKEGDTAEKIALIESINQMTRITGLADMTRARTSGLADLMNALEKQDDAITKYKILSLDADDLDKKKLYDTMAVKAQNRHDIIEKEIEKLTTTPSNTNMS